MKSNIFAQLALATGLVFLGTAQAATTMYAINGSGGISGFSTTTGDQVFSTTDLGLPSMFSNLSFGPDGYLYADSGGWSSNGYGIPIYKIDISNGQVSSLGGFSNGKFVFGSNDTLYTINNNRISGFNTTTGTHVFNTGWLNLSTAESNLSIGPNGFIYAGGGGYAGSGGSGAPIYKIDMLNGQARMFSGSNSSGEFVIGSNQRLYAINQSGGISGYGTITGSQVFGASGLNLNPAYGNLSFGPDGYLYANGGGSGAPIFKINTSNGQISVFSGSNSSGEFVFGSDNTLYTITNFGGIVGYNTATRQQVFNTDLLGLDPRYGNLSFGPDGYLYANGGGLGGQIFKINTSNGEVTWFDESSFSSGQFVFATSVPEVDTWGMLLVGLGLVGVAARRRKLAII